MLEITQLKDIIQETEGNLEIPEIRVGAECEESM